MNGKYKTVYMHREVLGVECKVDHKNDNKLCNEKWNLRPCTTSQNTANRIIKKVGTSKYRGVSWYKAYGKWVAQLTYDYKNLKLGYFENEIDAAVAYNVKAKELFGEFARLNIVE